MGEIVLFQRVAENPRAWLHNASLDLDCRNRRWIRRIQRLCDRHDRRFLRRSRHRARRALQHAACGKDHFLVPDGKNCAFEQVTQADMRSPLRSCIQPDNRQPRSSYCSSIAARRCRSLGTSRLALQIPRCAAHKRRQVASACLRRNQALSTVRLLRAFTLLGEISARKNNGVKAGERNNFLPEPKERTRLIGRTWPCFSPNPDHPATKSSRRALCALASRVEHRSETSRSRQ